MNKIFKTLQELQNTGIINFNDFYSITFDNYNCKLQGHIKHETIKKYKDKGFELELTEYNYIEAKQVLNGLLIKVVLT